MTIVHGTRTLGRLPNWCKRIREMVVSPAWVVLASPPTRTDHCRQRAAGEGYRAGPHVALAIDVPSLEAQHNCGKIQTRGRQFSQQMTRVAGRRVPSNAPRDVQCRIHVLSSREQGTGDCCNAGRVLVHSDRTAIDSHGVLARYAENDVDVARRRSLHRGRGGLSRRLPTVTRRDRINNKWWWSARRLTSKDGGEVHTKTDSARFRWYNTGVRRAKLTCGKHVHKTNTDEVNRVEDRAAAPVNRVEDRAAAPGTAPNVQQKTPGTSAGSQPGGVAQQQTA